VTLRAGAASRDITPELRGDFFGYVRPDLRARGVSLRLHAHALVLEHGPRRVGVVTLDLGAPLVAEAVFARVADLGLDRGNLLVAATHTHAGPNRPGAFVVDQVVAALREAVAALEPARAAWGEAEVRGANRNRSLEAHLANHGLDLHPGTGSTDLDPDGEDHPRDVTVRVLRIESPGGRPLVAWGHFSAHPTTFVPANTTFSSDFPGVATRRFRASFEGTPPVAIVTNGTEGDLIPRYDQVNQHACADVIGHRVATAMHEAWEAASAVTDDLPVAGTTRRIEYAGQTLEPGVRVADRAWFGLPFLGGAQNGPSFLYGLGLEGARRPAWLASRVHGRKLRAAPAPWPTRADVTVLRIGGRLLLGVPGEPTVEAGRRMCAAALAASDGSDLQDALIVGLAQAYRGYFTTPEEYDQQHYEGGHTVFGKHTSRLVELTHAALAAELAALPPNEEPSAVPEDAGSTTTSSARPSAPIGSPTLGRGSRRLRVTRQPPDRVLRFGVVTIGWRGARRGYDRPVDRAFLALERLGPGGCTEVVEDDLGTGFVWQQRGRRATARFELPGDLPLGTYRFVVQGVAAHAATDPFEVAINEDLRILGFTRDADHLVAHVQHPPPDPASALRARDRWSPGGKVRVRIGGDQAVARWDADRQRLQLPLEAPSLPTEVEVPDGGLEDAHGNRSGPGRRYAVGVVTAATWPPSMGPGGGRSPGPFGLGVRGRPPAWPFD
jgi:neutral ceramidase